MTQMGHDSPDAIAKYRTIMARFLDSTLPLMTHIGGHETSCTEPVVDDTRSELQQARHAFRLIASLLIRKARLHVIAVQVANRNCNLHSLAVQMRPSLECAGQVVSVFHNLFIASDPGAVDQYMSSDYRQTMQRLHKGQWEIGPFLAQIERAHPLGQPPKPKRLLHTDKVEALEGGRNCYAYLSRFHHPSLDTLRGPSALGGVASHDTPLDQLAFAVNLDYLAEQMLVMLAYAALPQYTDLDTQSFLKSVLTTLDRKRAMSRRHGVTLDSVLPNDRSPRQQ